MIDKRILVTGGAGYIGSHANALLNTLGFKTLVLDNLTLGHREALQYSPLQHISPNACNFLNNLKQHIESNNDESLTGGG